MFHTVHASVMSVYLADGPVDNAENITNFFNTGVGKVLATVMAAVGVLVILVGLFKAITNILGGKIGPAVKVIIGSIVLAAFMIFPQGIIKTTVNTTKNVITKITGVVDDASDSNGFNTTN